MRIRTYNFLITFVSKSDTKLPPRFKKHDGRQKFFYSVICGTRAISFRSDILDQQGRKASYSLGF